MDAVADPPAFAAYLEAGSSSREARVVGAGLRWSWHAGILAPGVRGVADLGLNHWSAPVDGGARQRSTQITLVPMLRWEWGSARGAFVEAGIGLSVQDRHYAAGTARQSSQWNFQDVLATGLRLAPGQELSLRYSHLSNAGLRRPNPGEDRFSLRWSVNY